MTGKQIVRMAQRQWGADQVDAFVERHGIVKAARLLADIFKQYDCQLKEKMENYNKIAVNKEPEWTNEWIPSASPRSRMEDESGIENAMAQFGSACRILPSEAPQQLSFTRKRR